MLELKARMEKHVLMRSIIRQTLGIKDHRITDLKANQNGIVIHMERIKRRHLPCSRCNQRTVVRDRLPSRRWRHVPLWGIPVQIIYRPWQVACPECGIKVEAIPWSQGKSPLSQPFIVTLATWSRLLAWDVVGCLFGVNWGTVRAAVRSAVEYGLSKREMDEVLYIRIDEST